MAITSFKGSLECVIVLAVAPSGVNCHKILETNMHLCNRVVRLLLITSAFP